MTRAPPPLCEGVMQVRWADVRACCEVSRELSDVRACCEVSRELSDVRARCEVSRELADARACCEVSRELWRRDFPWKGRCCPFSTSHAICYIVILFFYFLISYIIKNSLTCLGWIIMQCGSEHGPLGQKLLCSRENHLPAFLHWLLKIKKSFIYLGSWWINGLNEVTW